MKYQEEEQKKESEFIIRISKINQKFVFSKEKNVTYAELEEIRAEHYN